MRAEINRDRWPILFLALLVAVFFAEALFSGQAIWGFDIGNHYYYWRSFVFGRIGEGSLPLWNPYSFAGYPMHTDPQQGAFYPLNAIFVLFPIGFAITLSIAGHLVIAAAGVFLLCREYGVGRTGAVAGGVVYSLNGFVVGRFLLGSLPQICVISWLGFLFLMIERGIKRRQMRWFLAAGVINGLQILAGHPQFSYYMVVGAGCYFIFRTVGMMASGGTGVDLARALGGLAVFGGLGFGLGAVQILPTLAYAAQSTRQGGLSLDHIGLSSLPPIHLLAMAAPDFFGNVVRTPYWGRLIFCTTVMYAGIASLVLALIGLLRRPRSLSVFFVLMGAAGLVLALGAYTPAFRLAYLYLPGNEHFRLISRWLILYMFSISVLAAFGADVALRSELRDPETRLHRVFRVAVPGICVLALAVAILFQFSLTAQPMWEHLVQTFLLDKVAARYDLLPLASLRPYLFSGAAYDHARLSFLPPLAALVAASVGLVLFLMKKIPPRAFVIVMTALIIADLFAYGRRFVMPLEPARLHMPPALLQEIERSEAPTRMAAIVPQGWFPHLNRNMGRYYERINKYHQSYLHWGMIQGIGNIGGNYSLMDYDYNRFTLVDDPALISFENNYIKSRRALDVLGTRYLLLPQGRKPPPELGADGWRPVAEVDDLALWENLQALPRAVIVHRAYFAVNPGQAVQWFERPGFDPLREVVIQDSPPPAVETGFGHKLPYLDYGADEAPSSTVRFIEYLPEKVSLEASLETPGFLVLFDRWDADWLVFVNGAEARSLRADSIFRAVELPAGRHRVEFAYRPRPFMIGARISLAALGVVLAWGLGLLVLARRKKPARPEPDAEPDASA